MDQQNQEKPDQFFYHMAAVQATYIREVDGVNQTKQRNLNVLLQTAAPSITKDDLGTLNRTAIQRVCNEHEISPDAVKDVVFLGVTILGYMTPEEFEGKTDTPAEKETA